MKQNSDEFICTIEDCNKVPQQIGMKIDLYIYFLFDICIFEVVKCTELHAHIYI